ncbi:MAG: glycosyltransferase [Lentimonas sp.]
MTHHTTIGRKPRQVIAITTYNREVQLRDCLNCLTEATGLGKWHVIISDDCSTDDDIHEVVATRPLVASCCTAQSNLALRAIRFPD